jgi:hypothetical protein
MLISMEEKRAGQRSGSMRCTSTEGASREGLAPGTDFRRSQKTSRPPSCTWRGWLFDVLDVRYPKLLEVGVRFGGAKIGWLRVLNVSKRIWKYDVSVKWKFLRIDASRLLYPSSRTQDSVCGSVR